MNLRRRVIGIDGLNPPPLGEGGESLAFIKRYVTMRKQEVEGWKMAGGSVRRSVNTGDV